MTEHEISIPDSTIVTRESGPATKRYRRYKTVIDYFVAKPEFDLEQAKAHLAEQPAFITRLARDLQGTGWLLKESKHDELYRWNPDMGTFPAEKWIDSRLFGQQIKSAPLEQRPRERLLSEGVSKLTIAQLIAILIRSGRPGESAVMAGEALARAYQNRLQDLPLAGRGELKNISLAVEVTAYCSIMAGIELGRRIASLEGKRKLLKITSTQDAMDFCRQEFRRLIVDGAQEEFHIVTLNTKNQVLGTHEITVGTLDASLVHPRDVFRAAIRDSAQTILLVHNHPSGDPTPSREDFNVTRRLEQAGELMGIKVLDHIVVGRDGECSIREING